MTKEEKKAKISIKELKPFLKYYPYLNILIKNHIEKHIFKRYNKMRKIIIRRGYYAKQSR